MGLRHTLSGLLGVLFLTLTVLPTAQAPVTGVTVTTDRTDYAIGMTVTVTASMTYSGAFGLINEPARVEWRNESGVLVHAEYVPKARVSATGAESVASWSPTTPGVWRVTVSANATNGKPPLVTGSGSFTVWLPADYPSGAGNALPILAVLLAVLLLVAFLVVRRRRSAPGEATAASDPPVSPSFDAVPGTSYALLGERPDGAFLRFASDVSGGAPGLCITRIHPEKARERYLLNAAPVYWLTRSFSKDALNPTNLGAIVDLVRKQAAKQPGSRILLDGIEYLSTQNDFGKVAKFVQVLADVVSEGKAVLYVPLDPAALEEEERAILLRDLRVPS